MAIKGVFFDLYGTLLKYDDLQASWADWQAAFYEQLTACGLSMSRASFEERCDGFFASPAPLVRDDGLTVFERRIEALGVELGLHLSELEIEKTADVSVGAWQAHVSLDPDAHDVLKTLRASRRLALISNFEHPSHVYVILARFGLVGLFDTIIVSGDVGVEKPDPRIFDLALGRTGLQAREVVYVGDSPEDVEGALAAGLCPILIRRSGIGEEPAAADSWGGHTSLDERGLGGVETVSRLTELVGRFGKA